MAPHPSPSPTAERPVPLVAVAGLVALQGLGLVAIALFYLLESLAGRPEDLGRALVSALLALLGGVGLLLVGRGLFRCGRWARSPALVSDLIAVPVAIGLLQGGRWYVGLPLLLWAAAVIGLLFSRPVSAALEDSDGQR